MFKLEDKFTVCDENQQPYSFTLEQHTEVQNLHAGVQDGIFSLRSVGNRFILNTPDFSKGCFSMQFKITYMARLAEVLGETVESIYPFSIYLGYDELTRNGLQLRFVYNHDGYFVIELLEISQNKKKKLNTSKLTMMLTEEFYPLSVSLDENKVTVLINGQELSFSCRVPCGKLAIDRENFVGELLISNVYFTSLDDFDEELLAETSADIPCINGGDIPYTISWRIAKIADRLYFKYIFNGGTKTRFYNPDDRPGQYSTETDYLTEPYIGIYDVGRVFAGKILEGENVFRDNNAHWKEVIGRYLKDTDLPLEGQFLLPFSELSEDAQVIYGYKNMACHSYTMQAGGREFRYGAYSGELCYNGEAPDGRNIFELFSPADKFALSLIPEKCYKREEVVDHVTYNHYFEVSEDIDFRVEVKTKLNVDFLTLTAKLLNVYETEILAECSPEITTSTWDYGYHLLSASVKFPQMDVGVYKISFELFYGDKMMEVFTKTFEVFDKDSDLCPAIASGLPYIFTMNNELKWLMRNGFDLWNPMHSCDSVHYVSCITDTPIEARTRQVWELAHSFKREWFAWVGSRTTRDYSVKNNLDIIENADYLMLTIPGQISTRPNLWRYDSFQGAGMREILHQFLKDKPEIAAKLSYHKGCEDFEFHHFEELMTVCCDEWLSYVADAVIDVLTKRNEIIKKHNPKAKAAAYGPLPIYANSSSTYMGLRGFGMPIDSRLSEVVYPGFAILEDYPFSCSYQTYRGPFLAMTILLHVPDFVIYPEQYCGSRGGCIDGAVKFAHAPMGTYSLTYKQNAAHRFEYVFNTAYRTEEGFRYWNTYGFHNAMGNKEYMDGLVKEWRYVVENKPKKPLRTLAFVADYSCDENIYDNTILCRDEYNLYNRSESGHSYLHECSRNAGVTNGFCIKFETLKALSSAECDVLVLPTLKGVDAVCVNEIRRLYNEGVNLIAVSDVSGLEDIFGVQKQPISSVISSVTYKGETESVFNTTAQLDYAPCGEGKVTMWANDEEPVIITTERTMLINTALMHLGGECFEWDYSKSKHIIGKLITKALTEGIRRLSRPLALGENVGITLFETQKGETVLLAIDYTPFDNIARTVNKASIKIYMDDVTDAMSDTDIFVGKKDGKVKEIQFEIGVHEAVFITLKRKDA